MKHHGIILDIHCIDCEVCFESRETVIVRCIEYDTQYRIKELMARRSKLLEQLEAVNAQIAKLCDEMDSEKCNPTDS